MEIPIVSGEGSVFTLLPTFFFKACSFRGGELIYMSLPVYLNSVERVSFPRYSAARLPPGKNSKGIMYMYILFNDSLLSRKKGTHLEALYVFVVKLKRSLFASGKESFDVAMVDASSQIFPDSFKLLEDGGCSCRKCRLRQVTSFWGLQHLQTPFPNVSSLEDLISEESSGMVNRQPFTTPLLGLVLSCISQ